MSRGKVILNPAQFNFSLRRLCHQLVENYDDFSNTCLVGIQDKGVIFTDRLMSLLRDEMGVQLDYGKLDISFYRDDFRRRDQPATPSETIMNFLVEDKKVILADDVLYTGRTIQAAMTALQHFGRPAQVELLVFVDRRFNRHLPIKADYKGITVDAIDEAYVKVEWAHIDGKDQVKFFSKKKTA